MRLLPVRLFPALRSVHLIEPFQIDDIRAVGGPCPRSFLSNSDLWKEIPVPRPTEITSPSASNSRHALHAPYPTSFPQVALAA